MMRHLSFVPIFLAAFLSFSGEALAHKVNVFAYVDGDEIQVECSFSRSQKVRNGRLVITDLVGGGAVITGITDERGVFRFRPPDAFLATGHGLNIRLFAGEGHQADWKIAPEELRALSGVGRLGSAPEPKARKPGSGSPGDKSAAPLPAGEAGELEAIIGRVLDAKLSPIKQALARQEKDEPGLRDIVGGIGWILGLLGLATYVKHRR